QGKAFEYEKQSEIFIKLGVIESGSEGNEGGLMELRKDAASMWVAEFQMSSAECPPHTRDAGNPGLGRRQYSKII
ncbi:hypothetical protein M5Z12_11210, partial [Neisseria meningitidis]|nr:hypothetical protein [Neisseria meningitidis]